ncbi:LysR family transcriptional regulator [Streptomyces sp. TRM66268-LWL]|uniref:LysR family transcriptional regulator n=1 Tax=Streptomyces polyasparticus TaxID=2767826 RepID=A0ABR7SWB5_9ACTN|nr:LysR family transcriptional regulator [Streptomyces polyasparticus]MBC9719688.1 LysR family transcriptional regulator [Streptomyces polyasparticus]
MRESHGTGAAARNVTAPDRTTPRPTTPHRTGPHEETALSTPADTRDLSTAWLRVFLEVARLGSFTEAARALGYTQSAVSRQIQALESAFGGGALFDRLPRGVALTEQGRALLPRAEAVLAQLDGAQADLTALREVSGGRLRVGAFPTAGAALLPRTVAAFRERHPLVELHCEEGLTGGLLARLDHGELDLAVVSTTAGADLSAYALRKVLDEPMYVAVPAHHRLARRRRVRLSELSGDDWVSGSPHSEQGLLGPAVREDFHPRVTYVAAEWIAKQGYVAAGLAVALIPALAADGVRPDIRLLAVHEDDIPPRAVYAATLRGRSVPAAAEAFVRLLRAAGREIRPA